METHNTREWEQEFDSKMYITFGFVREEPRKIKDFIHQQLQKARHDWLRELQEAVEVKSENELFINPAKLKEIFSELDQPTYSEIPNN